LVDAKIIVLKPFDNISYALPKVVTLIESHGRCGQCETIIRKKYFNVSKEPRRYRYCTLDVIAS